MPRRRPDVVPRDNPKPAAANPLKRKRDPSQNEPVDPKLKEFIGVMQATAKTSTWQNDAMDGVETTAPAAKPAIDDSDEDEDEELQTIGKARATSSPVSKDKQSTEDGPGPMNIDISPTIQPDLVPDIIPQSDNDWLRAKTSRLLDLQDDEPQVDEPSVETAPEVHSVSDSMAEPAPAGNAEPEDEEPESPESPESVVEREIVEKSKGRLYLRNLAFDVVEDEIWQQFSSIGPVEEVRKCFSYSHYLSMMNFLIGTSDAIALDVNQGEYFSRCFSLSELGFALLIHTCMLLQDHANRLRSMFQWTASEVKPRALHMFFSSIPKML
jgi:multiple RNA-binding domain-containing protein 1